MLQWSLKTAKLPLPVPRSSAIIAEAGKATFKKFLSKAQVCHPAKSSHDLLIHCSSCNQNAASSEELVLSKGATLNHPSFLSQLSHVEIDSRIPNNMSYHVIPKFQCVLESCEDRTLRQCQKTQSMIVVPLSSATVAAEPTFANKGPTMKPTWLLLAFFASTSCNKAMDIELEPVQHRNPAHNSQMNRGWRNPPCVSRDVILRSSALFDLIWGFCPWFGATSCMRILVHSKEQL